MCARRIDLAVFALARVRRKANLRQTHTTGGTRRAMRGIGGRSPLRCQTAGPLSPLVIIIISYRRRPDTELEDGLLGLIDQNGFVLLFGVAGRGH